MMRVNKGFINQQQKSGITSLKIDGKGLLCVDHVKKNILHTLCSLQARRGSVLHANWQRDYGCNTPIQGTGHLDTPVTLNEEPLSEYTRLRNLEHLKNQ